MAMGMPPPPGMRGMGRPPGPRSFLTDEEKKNKPKITKKLLGRILKYLKPYRLQFLLVVLALAVSAVLGLMPSIVTGRIVDEIISAPESIKRLVILLITAFLVLGLSQIISVLEQYINSWISQMIIRDMRNQMYDHLQHMSHSFFTDEKQGDIITRMNGDINSVSAVISGTLTSIVSNILVIASSVFYMFYTDWRLAIVGLVIIPLLIIPTRVVGRKRWELMAQASEKHDIMNQHIDETLSVSGSMLVKLFTKEKYEYNKFSRINNEVTDITVKEHRAGSWFHVFLGMFIQIAPLLIYFAGAFLMIYSGVTTLTVGGISIIVALVNRLYQPVRMLLNVQVDFVRSLALFSRIFEYFDKKQDIVNPENPLKPSLDNCHIEFNDVHFSYKESLPILKGVSFKVPSGSMYAIVGASGAGKSTIINMIPRLYDVLSGSVKISGCDVRSFDLEYLRRNIGTVTQDTYLFNGTIMDNLLYAKENATKEEIEEACKIANIHDFIMSLPKGYDTVVGNRGLKLSGGEKQRVSIARVVLKNPKILILDEATSSLDSISESLIQSALEKVMKGRTCLVIAHRLTTVLSADCIMVLENGKITHSGKHEELLESSETYKLLYETQFRRILDNLSVD